MTVLGIDPGIAIVGFGAVYSDKGSLEAVQYGVIRTAAGLPPATRLCQIAGDLNELIEKFKPDAMAVEELFFNTNVQDSHQCGTGQGGHSAHCGAAWNSGF